MSKKQDAFYFDNFVACAELACKAARLLRDKLADFDPDRVQAGMDELHQIEHAADEKKHELTNRLAKAFITPIEREDMIDLSHHIDEMTDKIEEVMIRIYINNVKTIRQEAIDMLDVLIQCSGEVRELLKEFADFRHSRKLKDHIIQINSLEEKVDALYIAGMRNLHEQSGDFAQILAWREIYTYMEKCADACEHVADSVETVVMKNS